MPNEIAGANAGLRVGLDEKSRVVLSLWPGVARLNRSASKHPVAAPSSVQPIVARLFSIKRFRWAGDTTTVCENKTKIPCPAMGAYPRGFGTTVSADFHRVRRHLRRATCGLHWRVAWNQDRHDKARGP